MFNTLLVILSCPTSPSLSKHLSSSSPQISLTFLEFYVNRIIKYALIFSLTSFTQHNYYEIYLVVYINSLFWFIDDSILFHGYTVNSHYWWLLCSLESQQTELANTESLHRPSENTGLGSCQPLVTAFSSTNQYIILLYVHFCLRAPYLF